MKKKSFGRGLAVCDLLSTNQTLLDRPASFRRHRHNRISLPYDQKRGYRGFCTWAIVQTPSAAFYQP